MIGELRTILFRNFAESGILQRGNETSVSISKFHHGSANPDSKVIFLATNGAKPLAIVKIMRDGAFDGRLKNEMNRQKAENNGVINTPAVLFEDHVAGHFMYAEEVLAGRSPVLEDALTMLPAIVEYEKGKKSLGILPVYAIIESARKYEAGPYQKNLDELCGLLGNFGGENLDAALGHGDLTYKNIIMNGEKAYFIDWANGSDRPVRGIDIAHYLMRLKPRGPVDEWNKLAAGTFDSYKSLFDEKHMQMLMLIDQVYDTFQKDVPVHFESFVSDVCSAIVPK